MPVPFTIDEKLRVRFRKFSRKGYVRNAELELVLLALRFAMKQLTQDFAVLKKGSATGSVVGRGKRPLILTGKSHDLTKDVC
jgi:hypothetical protein